MDETDRLNLQKMISSNNVEDYTEDIRRKRHSQLIKNDLQSFLLLKQNNSSLMKINPDEFENLCIQKCSFLFNNYTDIFNKLKKDELDLNIFTQFLEILSQIENGKLDQHEGSYQVGVILKKLYVDSALRRSKHLDEENVDDLPELLSPEPKNISWKEWKTMKS